MANTAMSLSALAAVVWRNADDPTTDMRPRSLTRTTRRGDHKPRYESAHRIDP